MVVKFKRTQDGSLYAFLKPDRLFHLKNNQYGKGDGFEFRVYKTRATVRKHERIGGGVEITFEQFQWHLKNIFAEYLMEITLLIPKELRQSDNFKQLNS